MPDPTSSPLRGLLQTAADEIAAAARAAERLYRDSFVSTGGSGSAVGLYRAGILDGVDPTQRGRVQVLVPDVSTDTSWARLVQPLDGTAVTPPAAGSRVWVMFEGGDVAQPVVIGICAD